MPPVRLPFAAAPKRPKLSGTFAGVAAGIVGVAAGSILSFLKAIAPKDAFCILAVTTEDM